MDKVRILLRKVIVWRKGRINEEIGLRKKRGKIERMEVKILKKVISERIEIDEIEMDIENVDERKEKMKVKKVEVEIVRREVRGREKKKKEREKRNEKERKDNRVRNVGKGKLIEKKKKWMMDKRIRKRRDWIIMFGLKEIVRMKMRINEIMKIGNEIVEMREKIEIKRKKMEENVNKNGIEEKKIKVEIKKIDGRGSLNEIEEKKEERDRIERKEFWENIKDKNVI